MSKFLRLSINPVTRVTQRIDLHYAYLIDVNRNRPFSVCPSKLTPDPKTQAGQNAGKTGPQIAGIPMGLGDTIQSIDPKFDQVALQLHRVADLVFRQGSSVLEY